MGAMGVICHADSDFDIFNDVRAPHGGHNVRRVAHLFCLVPSRLFDTQIPILAFLKLREIPVVVKVSEIPVVVKVYKKLQANVNWCQWGYLLCATK